ncbi:MAG TPA: glycosyltransferase family 9 protein [Firmicutes bacterium]|nr:glycosyltransferase family 9 protein [Bacillota bacterium]
MARDTVFALRGAGRRVDILVKKSFAAAADETGADRVISYDPKNQSAVKLIRELNTERYDEVFDLHSNMRSRFIAALLKAKKKRRIKKHFWRRKLMVWLKYIPKGGYSVRDEYLKTCGLDPKEHPAAVSVKKIKRKKGSVRVLFHIGAKHRLKRWPHYAKLAELLSENPSVSVTITGIKDEVEKDDEILYIKKRNIRNMIGKTDQKGLLREIERCDVFVGNDTMAAHAASLYGKKAFVFLGPTASGFGFITKDRFDIIERDLTCRPCHLHGGEKCPIGDFRCLDAVSPEAVCGRIQKYIGKAGG